MERLAALTAAQQAEDARRHEALLAEFARLQADLGEILQKEVNELTASLKEAFRRHEQVVRAKAERRGRVYPTRRNQRVPRRFGALP